MSSSTFELRLATQPVLEDIAREGARRMLQHAIEQEVAGYIDAHQQAVDAAGHRLVVRNGHKPPRTLLTGCGPICRATLAGGRVIEDLIIEEGWIIATSRDGLGGTFEQRIDFDPRLITDLEIRQII